MAIDLPALARAAQGDQGNKVSVSKAWLLEVHKELCELQRRRQAEDEQTRQTSSRESDDVWDRFDKGMAQAFGKGGVFNKFGKKFR